MQLGHLTKRTVRTLAFVGLTGGMAFSVAAEPITGSPQDPNFEKVSDGAIAEFRSNGNNTSWSIATGSNTQDSSQMDNAGFAWEAGVQYNWGFDIEDDGRLNLSVWQRGEGDVLANAMVSFLGLTEEQMNANTLEIHAKSGVSIGFFSSPYNDAFQLDGDRDDRFGVDYAYIGLPNALGGFNLGGWISFSDPIGNQSASGVTFKVGNTPATVPEPGVLALLGLGLLGLVMAQRRRRS